MFNRAKSIHYIFQDWVILILPNFLYSSITYNQYFL